MDRCTLLVLNRGHRSYVAEEAEPGGAAQLENKNNGYKKQPLQLPNLRNVCFCCFRHIIIIYFLCINTRLVVTVVVSVWFSMLQLDSR